MAHDTLILVHCMMKVIMHFLEPTPNPMDVYIEDINIQTINISWSPLSLSPLLMFPDVNLTYTLTVTSNNTQPPILQLYQPYHVFTAPEGVPPCEVYNFSVTVTYSYVGTTYNGPDCSVPSPVLGKMLPSLPDIRRVESSLKYSLKKSSDRTTFLNASFLVSCDGIVTSACT